MEQTLTVTELTFAIKKHLEPRFAQVSVRGEVSNLKEQSSGHLYFTLKDAQSQISAVLFKGDRHCLKEPMKHGDQLVLEGELSLYAPRGSYQIIVRRVHYVGVGELLLKLHALKKELEARGWFDKTRKRPLPKIPHTIGVVTSPTGAVIQDILHVLTRRFSGFHLVLYPVKVQGEGAALEIAQAIDAFSAHKLADVLIVGRGGGSLEDLWAFNEEVVAKAIFSSSIPIISAVGHETDYCIADFVADVRAPTPSAAAEIAIAERAREIKILTEIRERLALSMKRELGKFAQLLDEAKTALESSVRLNFTERRLKLAALQKQTAALKPSVQIASHLQKLQFFRSSLSQVMHQKIERRKERLEKLSSHLASLSPKKLLAKGYGILFCEKKNSVILSSRELVPAQKLRIQMFDGEIKTTVDEIKT